MTGVVDFAARHWARARSLFSRAAARARAVATPPARDTAGTPRVKAQRRLSASRLIVMLAVIAMATTLACGGVGYQLARQNDTQRAFEQREALRGAISEFSALFGHSGEVDPRFVRMVEQSVGLKGLKFEADPVANGREMQPVIDAQWPYRRLFHICGRAPHDAGNAPADAAGSPAWSFAWSPSPASRCGNCAALPRELAASEEQARRAADEDKLTGLPNHSKVLDLLDLALGRTWRRPGHHLRAHRPRRRRRYQRATRRARQ